MASSTSKSQQTQARKTSRKTSSSSIANKSKAASDLRNWFGPKNKHDFGKTIITEEKLSTKRKTSERSDEEYCTVSKINKTSIRDVHGQTSKTSCLDKSGTKISIHDDSDVKKIVLKEPIDKKNTENLVSEQKTTARSSTEKEDLDLLKFMTKEKDLHSKENARNDSKKNETPRKNRSMKKSMYQENESKPTPVKHNSKMRSEVNSPNQISLLRADAHINKALLTEDGEILYEILSTDSEVEADKKISRPKVDQNSEKLANKTIGRSKSDKHDDKLLDDLLKDNSVKSATESNSQSQKNISTSKVTSPEDEISNAEYHISDDMFSEKFEFENDSTNSMMIDDLNDCFSDDWEGDKVDLNTLQRCKVISTSTNNLHDLIVDLVHVESALEVTVRLTDYWKHSKIEPDDFVVIRAVKQTNEWIVDNNNGFVISQPDHLVSGTAVVGALFCRRRGVLSDRFKGVDSALDCNRQDTSSMVIGSLVHELIQEVLKNKIHEQSAINRTLNDMLKAKSTIHMLYSERMSLETCRKEMTPFVPKIFQFVQQYVKGETSQIAKENFRGKINVVHDIEENLWIPQLGIKGKVDVTVEVNLHCRPKIMPLELKTGRASFSLEHRGQVILYTMMMAAMGQNVNAGLLLYLRENIMREIKVGHHEERDLILLRNDLAHYLTRTPQRLKRQDSGIESQISMDLMELPEPINHRACNNCPYSTLCCTYLKVDNSNKLSERHPLNNIIQNLDNYLKSEHIEYVMKWVNMIQIEETDQSNDILPTKSIWTMSPALREKKGKCIANLKVFGDVVEESNRYLHTFVRANLDNVDCNTDLTFSGFAVSDYSIVSSNTRINISSGRVFKLTKDSITMSLERNLAKKYPDNIFHIDTYNTMTSFTIHLSNIGYLLEDTPVTEKMRRIVIERTPATFLNKMDRSVATIGAPILEPLNEMQKRAVLRVLTANEYLLIKGMPGCGKTLTVVATIQLLVKMGKSVLLTAYTHSAVDNVLLRLIKKDVDFLRLGSVDRIHPSLINKSESALTKNCSSPESLEEVYNSKNVVAVTCLGAGHAHLGRRIFDVCLVDESTQVLQSSVLRPLYSASKFVLFGDPEQLPPIVRSNTAKQLGMDESLFERLDDENNTTVLALQYRMNLRIMTIANTVTYKNQLKAGSTEIENATLHIPNKSVIESCEQWVQSALSTDLDDSVVLLNTGNTRDILKLDGHAADKGTEDDRKCNNLYEVVVILHLITTLIEAGVSSDNIGIIAPYRAQVGLLRKMCKNNVEINTVDQYQGRDKNVIIYSGTRSAEMRTSDKEFTILDDQRRLTVAITRSKYKLIIVGDKLMLEHFGPFKNLFGHLREKDVLDLHDGHNEFSWEKLLSLQKDSIC